MKPMRHVAFTDNSDPDLMHLVPEHMVRFELSRKGGTRKLTAIFDDQQVVIPAGTAARFAALEAITAQGGYDYKEGPSPDGHFLPNLPKGPAQ